MVYALIKIKNWLFFEANVYIWSGEEWVENPGPIWVSGDEQEAKEKLEQIKSKEYHSIGFGISYCVSYPCKLSEVHDRFDEGKFAFAMDMM